MKAISLTKYGNPESLKVQEVPIPIPKENEVLIKICSTSVNDYDWGLVRGKPYIYRLMFGLTKPKRKIPGMELSGVIESLGTKANKFQVGDEVYGDISGFGFGSFADYICINENSVAKKPKEMSFNDAAAIPHAANLAFQGLVEIGKIKNGQKILINGGGGGVGTLGIQIAKIYDTHVTGVDSGHKLKMMKSIGFDETIDYKIEDFTKNGKKYDLILDCKTNRSPFTYVRSLNIDGKYVTIGGSLTKLLLAFVFAPLISFYSKKKFNILALKPNKDLTYIQSLYQNNKIKCIIDGPYSLNDLPMAIKYFGEGKHLGKVVISLV